MDRPISLPLATSRAYAEQYGSPARRIYAAGLGTAGAPVILPEADADSFPAGETSYGFPEVTHFQLSDTVVRGRSNLLTRPDAILTHDLLDPLTDLLPEEYLGRLKLTESRRVAGWVSYEPFGAHYLAEAAAFTDATAPNYAHWLTEVLPRIAAFLRESGKAKIPMLLDLSLHENLRRSVAMLTADHPIYRIRDQDHVRVGVLHHITATGYVPYGPRAGLRLEDLRHGRFNAEAIRHMVSRLRRVVNPRAPAVRPKLFIRRNSGARRAVNEADIEAELTARGFTVIEPDRMSFDEQISAFSDARIVVGATGAAITNLIFCRADCATVVLMPRFRHLAYRFWRNLALAAGAGPVLHAVGPQVTELEDPWHPNAPHQHFRVEPSDVIEAVDQALALTA